MPEKRCRAVSSGRIRSRQWGGSAAGEREPSISRQRKGRGSAASPVPYEHTRVNGRTRCLATGWMGARLPLWREGGGGLAPVVLYLSCTGRRLEEGCRPSRDVHTPRPNLRNAPTSSPSRGRGGTGAGTRR